MYSINRNGHEILEADACGIGFLASKNGVATHSIVEKALKLTKNFDHRGASGHGAGIQIDIPWGVLSERFPRFHKLIARRYLALGMFFFPQDEALRNRCKSVVEELALIAGSEVLSWELVPIDTRALEAGSSALKTVPVVEQALLKHPDRMSEDAWFACRFFLRLAIDHDLHEIAGDEFTTVSLSNRTVVYKGLSDLSKIDELYPDLKNEDLASRFVLFHSRYCTNTTTAWRRAQPFWSIAHNGEISTIAGNVAWFQAIGKDLVANLVKKFPSLAGIAEHVEGVICAGGSDTANLDDMMIALLAGGMSFPQAMLGLLPSAEKALKENDPLRDFYQAARIYLGACDGPAALVGCDGTTAVAHLDRNGLRPMWAQESEDFLLVASELTGTIDIGSVSIQKVLGTGETLLIDLDKGKVLYDEAVRDSVAREDFHLVFSRIVEGEESTCEEPELNLLPIQKSFGMTKEDLDVLILPMGETGKQPLGAMGDDTSPAAMLDVLPRRVEDHFKLRFAQETSPPVDPIRDEWVFDTSATIGDRTGLWAKSSGHLYSFKHRVLNLGEIEWLKHQERVCVFSILVDKCCDLNAAMEQALSEAEVLAAKGGVLVITDRYPSENLIALPSLRFMSQLHDRLVQLGTRPRVGLVADVGIWDVHHVSLHIAVGSDVVCPWIGLYSLSPSARQPYMEALRSGFVEAMSMMGVTPAVAYCGSRLIEALGLDKEFLAREFPGVPGHISGIGAEILNTEWLQFHSNGFTEALSGLVDAGEFRHTRDGRRHANNAEVVRLLQSASGYSKKIHEHRPGTLEAYRSYSNLVSARSPISILDLLEVKPGTAIPLDEVESVTAILWRFMAPGMSEGALSEPAHRAVAKAFNILHRYCRIVNGGDFAGIGPVANSGEGGFDKKRIGTSEGNRSIQYAGGRFTITPMTAACADEAEVKFAQGAKPGKGGQLPGKKVSPMVANRRGCEPGYELVSPPINHNLYSIEDVKLMLESWRHLNPEVNCSLKFVATTGIEMVAVGGVNAGANRIHVSDGCGGTGAAKRVDQKHAGTPVASALPKVHDMLIDEGLRQFVEVSVDGGVQNGEQVLKLCLLGADRVGFGTSLLVAIGCSMLRKCHLSGIDPNDPLGKRRLGCTPGIATQDPEFISRFSGKAVHIARFLRFVAQDVREQMANLGIRSLGQVIGQRDLLMVKPSLTGKARMLDLTPLVTCSRENITLRDYGLKKQSTLPQMRTQELELAQYVLDTGKSTDVIQELSNADRCVGVGAAGLIARKHGDLGTPKGVLQFIHHGVAGHYYAAYSVDGLKFDIKGNVADSCFTAAYGGLLVVKSPTLRSGLALVGSCFGYGAKGGKAFIGGLAGNRFGICFRKNHEGGGPCVVVEGVGANAFQYMTGGVAVVLGPTGANLGAGMTGGKVYLLDADDGSLNHHYVNSEGLSEVESYELKSLLEEHLFHTGSEVARVILRDFEPKRFSIVKTRLAPETLPEWNIEASPSTR